MSPDLTPLDLDSSSFHLRYQRLPLQKGRSLPILVAEGTIGGHVPPDRDLLLLAWSLEELRTEARSHLGVVLDATGLHTTEPLPVELFPERVRRKDEPYGVVRGHNPTDFATTIPPSHVAADLGELVARLTLEATGELQPFTPTRSSVVVRAFTWTFEGEVAAWVEMTGRYPQGSAGDDDAQFIRWRLNRVERLVKPRRWIVDLRGLDYVWGDKFDPEPTSVLRGDAECRFLVDRSRADPFRFAVAEELTCEFTDEALAQLADSQRQPRSSPAE